MLIEMSRMSRDQKRKQQLAERRRRLDNVSNRQQAVTALTLKDRVAEAVHAAVCEVAGGNGFGRCAYYAVSGSVLASLITGKRYIPQAGSLYLAADPADPTLWTAMVCEDGIESGEFHCWCVGPVEENRKSGPITPDVQIVDFSSRHFKAIVEKLCTVKDRQRMCGGFITLFDQPTGKWLRPDPPKYLWSNRAGLPEWVVYEADMQATETLFKNITDFEPVIKLAGRHLSGKK